MKREKLKLILTLHNSMLEQCKAYELALTGNGQSLGIVESFKQQILIITKEVEELIEEEGPKEAGILTNRETEVLGLVAQGFLNKEIAYKLSISERTVQFHLKSVFTKLDVSSRTEAVTKALKSALISL